MNIDQFISKLESSDAYRNNGEVKKLVDESRQTLIDLAHGNDGDAFKAELMKFNARLDECLNPGITESRKADLVGRLGLEKQYDECLLTLSEFGFSLSENLEGNAPVPFFEGVVKTFTPEQLELAVTFQEPTLLLVPETSFAAKVEVIDTNKTMEGQTDTLVEDPYKESDSGSEKVTGWKAVIVDGAREMKIKEGDDVELELLDRVKNRMDARRQGEKGMDRHAYAMLMMESLSRGEPIDKGEHMTLLDDDPAVSSLHVPCVDWNADEKRADFRDMQNFEYGYVRFRSSVGGDVLLNAVDSSEAEPGTYTVEVNYDLPLNEAIAAGKYDEADGNISAHNFPPQKKKKEAVDIRIIDLGLDKDAPTFMGSYSYPVSEELEKQGFRPATLSELLALGAAYPDLQRKSPIVAYGSEFWTMDKAMFVPYLWDDGGKRCLGWTYGNFWQKDYGYRFAVVRK